MKLIDAAERATAAGQIPALVRAAQGRDSMAMAELLDMLTPYVGRLRGPIALDDGADAAQEALIKETGRPEQRNPPGPVRRMP